MIFLRKSTLTITSILVVIEDFEVPVHRILYISGFSICQYVSKMTDSEEQKVIERYDNPSHT